MRRGQEISRLDDKLARAAARLAEEQANNQRREFERIHEMEIREQERQARHAHVREEFEQRIHHLAQARDHLRSAGLQDMAEEVQRRISAEEREWEVNQQREESNHHFEQLREQVRHLVERLDRLEVRMEQRR